MIKEISLELILNLNCERYCEWLLNGKTISRREKKKIALNLMGLREKTISNYRLAINEIFINTRYWKEPTAKEKEFFPIWVEMVLEDEIKRFNSLIDGSPLPLSEIRDQEVSRIISKVNKLYIDVFECLIGRIKTEKYYELSNLIGLIAYLKWLYNPKKEIIIQPSKLSSGKLESYFNIVSKYKLFMELLATKGYCQELTYIWTDEGKGNKGLLVAILKDLHAKGYLNRKLTEKETQNVCNETFKVILGIDTIKKTKKGNYDLNFIPPSTAIN